MNDIEQQRLSLKRRLSGDPGRNPMFVYSQRVNRCWVWTGNDGSSRNDKKGFKSVLMFYFGQLQSNGSTSGQLQVGYFQSILSSL